MNDMLPCDCVIQDAFKDKDMVKKMCFYYLYNDTDIVLSPVKPADYLFIL